MSTCAEVGRLRWVVVAVLVSAAVVSCSSAAASLPTSPNSSDAASTACATAIAANRACVPMPDDPVGPVALRLGSAETMGLHVVTDQADCPNVVNIGSNRAWGSVAARLYVDVVHVTGLSRLADADLPAALRSRLDWTGADVVDVDGRTALTVAPRDGGDARWLAVARRDDLLVTASAGGLSLDQLIAAVNSLTPTEPSSCRVVLPID